MKLPRRGALHISIAACGKILITLACTLFIVLIGARVAHVNANALSYPTVHHKMGEWVELDGAFIYERTSENTAGYAVRVSNAELLSYNEYIELYGEDPDKLMPNDQRRDIKSILCLALELRNHNSDGAFFIGEAKLIPEADIKALRLDRELWMESNKNIDPAIMFLMVYPETEFTLHVPYLPNTVAYSDRENRYAVGMPGKNFSLIVSTAPVRHIIDITL